MHWAVKGCLPGGVSTQVWCLLGSVCGGEVSAGGSVCLGVSAQGVVAPDQRQTPPWDQRQTLLVPEADTPPPKTATAADVRIAYSPNDIMITILREPVARYLSEWKHVTKGARWKEDSRLCADSQEPCTIFGRHLGLHEFISCLGNMGNNRQTRLLADLRNLNCTTETPNVSAKKRMLESAKINLAKMHMFGLNEYFYSSQYLLSWTFGFSFKDDIEHRNSTHVSRDVISEAEIKNITTVNRYDMQLYQFAKKLFFTRLQNAIDYDKKNGKIVPKAVEKDVLEFLEQ